MSTSVIMLTVSMLWESYGPLPHLKWVVLTSSPSQLLLAGFSSVLCDFSCMKPEQSITCIMFQVPVTYWPEMKSELH